MARSHRDKTTPRAGRKAVAVIAAWIVWRLLVPRGSPADGAATPDVHTSVAELDEPPIELDTSQESIAAATGAAVVHILDRPDSIRQRAQNAATIANAVVAALVIAAFSGFAREQVESWTDVTKVLLILAGATWVGSVVLSLTAVAFVRPEKGASNRYPHYVLSYQRYASRVRKRLRLATVSSTIALVVAALAVAAEIAELTSSGHQERMLVLTPIATSAVAQLCGQTAPAAPGERASQWSIQARVGTTALSRQLVPVDVTYIVHQNGGTRLPCVDGAVRLSRREDGITIRLPRAAIISSAEVVGEREK
jgi:hypothetical protein